MKKNILLGLFFAGICISSKAQENYQIKGKVTKPVENMTLYMLYMEQTGNIHKDSCKVINDTFSFKGTVDNKTLAYLVVPPDKENMNSFLMKNQVMPKYQIGIYLESGIINVKFDPKDEQSVWSGGTPNNNAVQEARSIIWKYKNEEASISTKLRNAGDDSIQRTALEASYFKMIDNRTTDIASFAKKNPSALASLDLLRRWVSPIDDRKNAQKIYNYLSLDLKKSTPGIIFGQQLEQAAKVDINSIAPDFALKDTSGIEHKLSDYKGKYVLIDFWASWCMPCLQEMPNVVSAYNDFKHKNFEILGVSLDGGDVSDAHEKWAKAIIKNNMSWPQFSDLMGWNSTVSKQYMVNAIPMNFLLDPNGKIVAKNLRGNELSIELNKYLNK